jgi:dynein heavy chain
VLYKLTSAEGDILENVDLVENLETAKAISEEVKEKVIIAKETTIAIDTASEQYRPAAHRGALIFFLMNELFKIHTFYMFALEAYLEVIIRAIKDVAQKYAKLNSPEFPDAEEGEEGEEGEAGEEGEKAEGEEGEEGEKAEGEEGEAGEDAGEEEFKQVEMSPRTLKKRVSDLIDSITYFSFTFVRRGMLEVHKLIFSTMLTFRIMIDEKRVDANEVNLLISAKPIAEPGNIPENLNFLTEQNWGLAKLIEQVPDFSGLIQNMEVDYLQWKRWFGEEKAETVDLPRQFKEVDLFKRMILLRAFRPDRLTSALTMFVGEQMGERYVEQMPFDMTATFEETNNRLPVFFVLFPGYDPTVDVEKIGATMDISIANGKMINISMGQG